MVRFSILLAFAMVSAVAFAAPIPKGIKNKFPDKEAIVGDWLEAPEKARIWWFKEDGTAGGGDLKSPTRKGLYRMDPMTEPKSLDWSDDNGATWQLGVYSLEKDVLIVNIASKTSDPRPTSLDENNQTHKISATRKKADK